MNLLRKFKDRIRVSGELLRFMWRQKMWWMIPMMVLLLALGLFLFVGLQTPLGPAIYALF